MSINSHYDAATAGELNRQHVWMGVIAGFLSVLLHVGALFLLSDVKFDVTAMAQAVRRDARTRYMQLLDVDPTAASYARRPDELRPGDGSLLPDLPAESKELGLSPDKGALEPPAVLDSGLEGDTRNLAEPSDVPLREAWEPRQKILVVENKVAADNIPQLTRKPVAPINRIDGARDIVVPVDRDAVLAAVATPPAAEAAEGGRPAQAQIDHAATQSAAGGGDRPLAIGEADAASGAQLFEEIAPEVTPYRALDNFLTARVTTYCPFGDFKYGYFRIEIERVGESVLPVLPKDVVLVQDCSASMTEQRLYFCRQALDACLDRMGPKDRFNVVSFRDAVDWAFPEWAENAPGQLQAARAFISGMTSGGNTDIFASMKALNALPRQEGRPVVALLVTDGRATTGLTGSSDIIGEFSKLNDGRISVFTLGTVQTADTYMLDLLSYCNRGDTMSIAAGRWGIPEDLLRMMDGVSRPVLSDLAFRFATGQGCEVYPVLTSNLYLDRPLVIYGRYPRNLDQLVFQAVGEAGDQRGDMLFDLSLEGSKSKEKDIRESWALQKIYHLIGQNARHPDQSILDEIGRTSRAYGVRVPYRERL